MSFRFFLFSLLLRAGSGAQREKVPCVVFIDSLIYTRPLTVALCSAGLRPIATCSPKHFNLVKRFGAVAAFDYRDANAAAAIRSLTKNELAFALDCVSTAETTQMCYDALGRAGGRYAALEPFRTAVTSKRSLTVTPSWLLALTIFGKNVALDGEYAREALPEHKKVGVEAYAAVQKLLDGGLLGAHPARVVEGTWEDVIKGVDEVRAQNLSGVKLVYVLR